MFSFLFQNVLRVSLPDLGKNALLPIMSLEPFSDACIRLIEGFLYWTGNLRREISAIYLDHSHTGERILF